MKQLMADIIGTFVLISEPEYKSTDKYEVCSITANLPATKPWYNRLLNYVLHRKNNNNVVLKQFGKGARLFKDLHKGDKILAVSSLVMYSGHIALPDGGYVPGITVKKMYLNVKRFIKEV